MRHYPANMFADRRDPETRDKDNLQELLDRVPEPVLPPRIISDLVNSVPNNGPELLQPVDD